MVLPRPRKTRIPASKARPVAIAASRDLPMPASPTRNADPPRPARVPDSARVRSASSASLPINSGARVCMASDPNPSRWEIHQNHKPMTELRDGLPLGV
jgi:hypothetical protein